MATNAVKNPPPDGHTLLMATIGFGANPALFREKLPYDVVKDFTHITKLVMVPVILVAHPSVGVKTPTEFLAKAKAQPGHLTFQLAGFGTVNHLAGEMLKAVAGVNLTHVPYGSGRPVIERGADR